jgi:hypothetical protein
MALAIALVFSQVQDSIVVTSNPGEAFYAVTGAPVTISVQATGGTPAGLLFEVLTGPVGSALDFPLTGTGSTLVVTPDVAGGYGPVQVTANGIVTIRDRRALSVKDAYGIVQLPLGTVVTSDGLTNEANFPGNVSGLGVEDLTHVAATEAASAAVVAAQTDATTALANAATASTAAAAANTNASTRALATRQVHVGSGSSGFQMSHTDGSYGAGPLDLTADLYFKITGGTSNAKALGWFDVTDPAYGAVGDGVTDDGPAFQLAINAAIDWTGPDFTTRYARRAGTVYVPPCAQQSSYRIATPVTFDLKQAEAGTGGPCSFRMICNGADGPIKPDLTNSQEVFYFHVEGLEWNRITIDNICSVSRDIVPSLSPSNTITRGATAECFSFLHIEMSTGSAVVNNMMSIGTWCTRAQLHLGGGADYTVNNYHDSGALSYDPAGNAGHIFCDQVGIATINHPFNYGEFLMWGVDDTNGFADALIKIDPSSDAGWGPSQIYIRGIQCSNRCTNMVYCYPTHGGTVPAAIIDVNGFHAAVNTELCQIFYCDRFNLRNGKYIASVQRNILDGGIIKHVELSGIDVSPGSEPLIILDGSCPHLEVIDTALGVVSGSPCGIELAGDTSTAAFVTTNGVRARVRRAQASIVSNTLAKWGATDGRIDQLGTGDDARLVAGVVLDTAATNDYVRIVEGFGQSVPIKTDGAGTLAPGDQLTASGASAGRVKKTTSAGASTVGQCQATIAATADLLVNANFVRGQY